MSTDSALLDLSSHDNDEMLISPLRRPSPILSNKHISKPVTLGSARKSGRQSNDLATAFSSALEEEIAEMAKVNSDVSVVFAMNTFVASIEGQASVLKGDTLILMDDSHNYWWLIRSLKTNEIGYIPADNVETQPERLARLNKIRNVRLAAPIASEAASSEENLSDAVKDNQLVHFVDKPKILMIESADYDSSSDSEGSDFISDDGSVEAAGSSSVSLSEPNANQPKTNLQMFMVKINIFTKFRRWLLRVLTKSKTPKSPKSAPSNSKPESSTESSAGTRTSFIDRLFTRRHSQEPEIIKSANVKVTLSRARSRSLDASSSSDSRKQSASSKYIATSEENAIILLKIFSGNYDFKATYKTVAITRKTKISEVIQLSLQKFKVTGPGSRQKVELPPIPENVDTIPLERPSNSESNIESHPESNYYISVVHGDSKERKLHGDDNIMDVLLKLQSKGMLPGIRTSKDILQHMRHVNPQGKVSSIRTPNDSEIKFLLNMKQGNEFLTLDPESNMFIRIYYYGDHFNSGTLRTHKTISVKAKSSIRDVIDQAVRKFKINNFEPTDDTTNYNLWKAKERLVALTENTNTMASLQHIDPFSPAFLGVESIILPAVLLDEKQLLLDLLRQQYENDTFGDELAFVLKEAQAVTNPVPSHSPVESKDAIETPPPLISDNPSTVETMVKSDYSESLDAATTIIGEPKTIAADGFRSNQVNIAE